MMSSNIEKLKEIIKNAEKITFFGGAGVSTASGIPDFRGAGGLYTLESGRSIRPETILSHGFFYDCPEEFYEYYKSNMLYTDTEPNGAHYALAGLEKIGKLSAVITQNIDGLHTAAGSRNVIELHGSVLENYCVSCGRRHPLSHILSSYPVPRCESCGGLVRPDVVLYGEPLDVGRFMQAEEEIMTSDVLIVGGTSLTVTPASTLVEMFEGEHLVIINRTETEYDYLAELVIREPIDEVLSEACEDLF